MSGLFHEQLNHRNHTNRKQIGNLTFCEPPSPCSQDYGGTEDLQCNFCETYSSLIPVIANWTVQSSTKDTVHCAIFFKDTLIQQILFVDLAISASDFCVRIKRDFHKAVEDLRGPKFFQFHAVFGKIWQNRMLAPPPGVSAPSSGKSWFRHCKGHE